MPLYITGSADLIKRAHLSHINWCTKSLISWCPFCVQTRVIFNIPTPLAAPHHFQDNRANSKDHPNNMIVLFLISLNSLILLYCFPLFKMLTKVREGQQYQTPFPLLPILHKLFISLWITWVNWSRSRNSLKSPPKHLRTTHWNCPVHSMRDFGVDGRGWGASPPLRLRQSSLQFC